MGSTPIDQLIHDLIWKAGPVILLCGCGTFVFRELVRRIARQTRRNIHARLNRTTPETPHCPSCDRPMVKRMTRRGFRAGAEYWGCSNYPVCTDTRSVLTSSNSFNPSPEPAAHTSH